eukprot:2861608-Pyramimonas_sp.AAC.1
MELYFGKNKTAALMCASGSGARQTNARICEGEIKLTADAWDIAIDVVLEYRYMGTAIVADGSWGPEVQRRVVARKNAPDPMLRAVFKDDVLPAGNGANFVDAMTNARLTCQAELWCGMAAAGRKQRAWRGRRAAAGLLCRDRVTRHVANQEAC